jgi:pimeloyl-ACP methyl ester carboxylesterase
MQLVVNGKLAGYEAVNPKAKKTILILHGWGHNAVAWLPLSQLLPKDWRVILLDLPGFGQSALLPAGAGVPEYAEFVTAFMKKLGVRKPFLLGHSFGGQIAMFLAYTKPELISRLLLLSPAGIRTKTKKQKVKVFLYKRFKYLRILLPPPLLKWVIRQFTSTDYLNASKEHKLVLKKIVTQDLTHQLPMIKVPTELIWGELDKEIPYAGKLIANAIPDCRLYVMYGADHNPHLSKTTALAELLKSILSI